MATNKPMLERQSVNTVFDKHLQTLLILSKRENFRFGDIM